MIRLLLTGASGFLGQHLLHQFMNDAEQDYEIFALFHSMQSFQKEVAMQAMNSQGNSKIHVHSVDLTNQDDIDQYFQEILFQMEGEEKRIHACIHTAAVSSPRVCQQDPDRARQINVPAKFFDALVSKAKVQTIIALSTDQVYGGDAAPYLETDAVKPLNVYSQSKVEMEDCLSKLKIANVYLLRSSIILGPKAPFLPDKTHDTFLHFCHSRSTTETTFFTDECRSVIFVENVVEICRRLIAGVGAGGGVYNMGGPHGVSRMDMAHAVFEQCGFDSSKYLKSALKAEQPPAAVPSPLDITMNVQKIQRLLPGLTLTPLSEIVQATFPKGLK